MLLIVYFLTFQYVFTLYTKYNDQYLQIQFIFWYLLLFTPLKKITHFHTKNMMQTLKYCRLNTKDIVEIHVYTTFMATLAYNSSVHFQINIKSLHPRLYTLLIPWGGLDGMTACYLINVSLIEEKVDPCAASCRKTWGIYVCCSLLGPRAQAPGAFCLWPSQVSVSPLIWNYSCFHKQGWSFNQMPTTLHAVDLSHA